MTRARTAPITPSGYEVGAMLGRGGMGEVVLAHDTRLGRDVAIKVINSDEPDDELLARFLCEAKIQARLEHPAIVPVHEIGRDLDGRPFFTMKRIAGKTLAELIATPDSCMHRLLRALVDVCLAIEFAHARAVVHRDLKPSNIMLGDFGEVYVLDWGLARGLEREDGTAAGDHHTEHGSLLGTPGYAAPEQVSGDDVDRPADVYSLGAILFEILTRQPLHPRLPEAAIASTLADPTRAPASCHPGVAPELDAICMRALAATPSDRPSARALADAIVRYLDGDRDVERRRALAREHLDAAHAMLASGDPERRADAMRAAGRALALDPESEAAEVVATLMCETSHALPAGLEEQLAKVDTELASRGSRGVAFALSAYFLFVPFVLWCGVTSPLAVAGLFGYIAVQTGYNAWVTRRGRAPSLVAFTFNILLALLLERMFGPLVVVPAIVVAFGVLSARQAELIDRPWLLVGVALTSFLLPIALELAGVLAPTWSITDGAISIRGAAVAFDGARAAVFLVAVNVALIVVATVFGWTLATQRRAAQQRFEIQAWHLNQLLPAYASEASAGGPPARAGRRPRAARSGARAGTPARPTRS